MTRNLIIAGILAAALHVTVLFGPHRITPPRPLPVAPESLEVELTFSHEEAASAPEISASLEPIPEPIPEPISEPISEPEATAPEPPPEPVRKPAPPAATAKPKLPAPKLKPKTVAPVPERVAPTAGGQPNGTASAANIKSGSTTGVRVRSNPPPPYPAAARSAHQEGLVTLDVQVSATGIPTTVSLASGSGFPALDQAAIAAVHRWRFEPAKVAGNPVAGRVRVPIRFHLER